MSRPTMSDVAKLAGVSKTTVSLVISGHATDGAIKISAQTPERVLSAVQQLGYNVNARSMSAKRTRTFGLVTFMFSDHAPSVILPSAQKAAHGYFLMVSKACAWAPGDRDDHRHARLGPLFCTRSMLVCTHSASTRRFKCTLP